jgi:iron complex outermembrane receptor protein
VPAGVTGAEPYETTNATTGDPVQTNLVGYTGDNWYQDDTLGFSLKFAPSDVTRLDLTYVNSKSDYGYDQPITLLRTSVTDPNLGVIDDISTLSTIPLTTWLNGAVFARGGMADQDNTGLTFRTAWNDLTAKLAIGQIDKHTETYIVGGATPVISAPSLVGGDGRIAPMTDSKKTTVDLQFDLPLFDSHLLTFGVADIQGELENERWNLSDWTHPGSKVLKISDTQGEDEIRALYLQDAYSITNSLTAYIGVRQDWWEFDGGEANFYNSTGLVRTDTYDDADASATSPKLSLVYRPVPETTYRTSIGKAFRAPMLFELIQTSGIAGQTFIGNPDLEPEKVTSWEIGVDHTFGNGINGIATYYQSQIKDLIETVTIAAGPPAEISPQNIGEADINGLELELRGPLPYGFSWMANYTYTDSEVTDNESDPTLEGKQLVHVPKTQYNLGLDWQRDAWLVSAVMYHQSKRYTRANNTDTFEDVPGSTDPFSITDVKATYKFSDKHSAALGVSNLFDEEYHQFYLSPGRTWFAELRAEY